MGEIGNSEFFKNHECNNSPYVRAILNPNTDQFLDMAKSARNTILEIGCGAPPRMSWAPRPGDLWIGCDPSIRVSENQDSINVHKLDRPIIPNPNLVVLSKPVEVLPIFKPDVLISVAPNPMEIVENHEIFNDELERFLSPTETQIFIIALEKEGHTEEGRRYLPQAKSEIKDWLRRNLFAKIEYDEIKDLPPQVQSKINQFHANSADLRAKYQLMAFIRNF